MFAPTLYYMNARCARCARFARFARCWVLFAYVVDTSIIEWKKKFYSLIQGMTEPRCFVKFGQHVKWSECAITAEDVYIYIWKAREREPDMKTMTPETHVILYSAIERRIHTKICQNIKRCSHNANGHDSMQQQPTTTIRQLWWMTFFSSGSQLFTTRN